MVTIIIDKKNKFTIKVGDKSIVKNIPSKEQKRFVMEMFSNDVLLAINEDGKEMKIPVLIHNNITGVTTTLHDKGLTYDDYYAGIPNSTRYRPNKLVTFEKDRNEWMLDRIKRTFNTYDNDSSSEQDVRIAMRKLLNR